MCDFEDHWCTWQYRTLLAVRAVRLHDLFKSDYAKYATMIIFNVIQVSGKLKATVWWGFINQTWIELEA